MTGYKDPPKHSQYGPGVSGNPGGRPKGRSIFADMAEELQQQAELADGTSSRKVSKQRLLVIKLIDAAVAGDLRAIATVLNMCPRKRDDDLPEADEEEHQEIFDALTNRAARRDQAQPTSKNRKE